MTYAARDPHWSLREGQRDAPPRIKQDFVWFGRNWSQEQDMGEPIKELNADDQVF